MSLYTADPSQASGRPSSSLALQGNLFLDVLGGVPLLPNLFRLRASSY